MRFYVEYDIPPLRGISFEDFKADNEEQARKIFSERHPRGRIRKIACHN